MSNFLYKSSDPSKKRRQSLLMSEEIDSCFNLTTSYRRDSDIVRYYGDIESEIRLARFDEFGILKMEDQEYFKQS